MQIGSSVFSPLKHHGEWFVGISDKPLFSYKVYLTLSLFLLLKFFVQKNEVINIFSIFVAQTFKLSVMEKDYQNNNSISDAANNNEESNKPEHEIKVEIVSIEVVGEDTPPKHSKKYERWVTTAFCPSLFGLPA